MAYLDDKLDKLNNKCDTNNSDITDTQIAVTEAYEKTLSSESDITDIQLALAELYELIV